MNIYDFFNSRDIAKHCENINYQLNSFETAYIIWQSYKHTVKEKHKAYQEIIDSYPDVVLLPKWPYKRKEPLLKYLEREMNRENKLIERFLKLQKDTVYTYAIGNDNRVHYEDVLFFDYKECLAEIQSEVNDRCKMRSEILIKKQKIRLKANEETHSMTLRMNSDFQILGIELERGEEPFGKFLDYCIMIPTPFKAGDIVAERCSDNDISKSFVLEWIPYWEKDWMGRDNSRVVERFKNGDGDFSDMQVSYWSQDDRGEIFWDHGATYLNLEYDRDELKGRHKLLLTVKNFVQGKIYLDDLLRSHSVLLMENYAKDLRNCGKINEIMIDSGLM